MLLECAKKKPRNEPDPIQKDLHDLKDRRNKCEGDLRLLQQNLNSRQQQLLDFHLAGDETKTRILQQAIAKMKEEIAEKEEEIEENEAVLTSTPQEKDNWEKKANAAREERESLRQTRLKAVLESRGVSYLDTLQITQRKVLPETDPSSFEWLDFVKTKEYDKISDKFVQMFNREVDHRSMIIYTLAGPMGSGKTRWCSELSKDLSRAFSSRFLAVYLNMKKVSTIRPYLDERGLKLVGQLLIFGIDPLISTKTLSGIEFREIENKLQENGIDKILLIVDETQVDREFATLISNACELTFIGINTFVIPVFAGIRPPSIQTDPSGTIVRNIFIHKYHSSVQKLW